MFGRRLWLYAGPLILVITVSITASEAYGHAVAACCWTGFYRIDNENFTPPVTTVGKTIVLTGELRSLVNRPLTITPLPVFDMDANASAVADSTSNSQFSWQLVNSSTAGEFVLEPGETFPFKFEIKALKAGIYHLHSAFNATSIGLSLGRGQTISVYSDSRELNEKESSYYMLQAGGKNQVIEYHIRDLENNKIPLLEVDGISASPQNMSISIKLSRNATVNEQDAGLRPSPAYFDLVLSGENLAALAYPSKFSVYVDGKNVLPERVDPSCNYYYLRIPISLNSKDITLRGIIDDSIPTQSQAPHTKIFQPVKVSTVQPRNEADNAGQSNSHIYFFEVGLATNADVCRVDVIDLLQQEKRLHVTLEGLLPSEHGEPRFLSITIPQRMLGGNYTVLADNEPLDFQQRMIDGSKIEITDPSIEASEKWSVISLNYTSNVRGIDIIGTTAIPEFHSRTIIGIAMIIAVGGIIMASKGRRLHNGKG